MAYELQNRGLSVVRQLALPVVYEYIMLDEGFRIDLMVENVVIVDLKSVEMVIPVHKKQLNTYLQISGKGLGYW